ncbi:MAG TPA: acetylornithine/succinylornithine family transaminase [Methanomicrobiales archaeon]|nr:acetylornithine/succinylornithine family transaminase [Methanomicrobiales archaeon]
MEGIEHEKELEARYYQPVFTRDMKIVRGAGAKVWDAEGNEYIDLVAGIAVVSTGHCHPAVVRAICQQAGELIHCSNLYYVPHQLELAQQLSGITGLSKVFLTNSGTEATEAAIKLARVRTGRKDFVAFTHGFHGRTTGALAVTHKPGIREPFLPLEPKCTFVDYGDLEGLRKAVTRDTAGVFVEPIQGEAGIIIPPEGFMAGVREICDATGALFIDDEVQAGMGRTGKWLAIEYEGVTPDIVTLAKGIGSGFPMGALVAREGLEFKKGEHGSTFAGGPIACAAGLATIGVIREILPAVIPKGERFRKGLSLFNPRVRGLMIGITVGEKCPEVQRRCAARGVLVNCAADGNIRLVPPLVIRDDEIDASIEVIHEALG